MRTYLPLLFILLLFPVLATEDLTSETYITPAYGHYLEGDYYYINGGAAWLVYGDTFETLGYYPVFENNDEITLNASVKASFSGDVFFCITDDTQADLSNCDYIGSYTNTTNFEDYSYTGNLDDLLNIGGKYYSYIALIYDDGGYDNSFTYSFYYNIEEAYGKKMPISLASDYNFSDGVITLTLNETITDMIDGNIWYDSSNLNTLSGTFSNLLFLDNTGGSSKAYPYYIDTYKGGYYDYNNNTADDTVIKLFIDEDVVSKGILMYYDYYSSVALEGYYSLNENYDSNNNPFVIHQVFSDFRWNYTQFSRDIVDVITDYNSNYNVYTRGEKWQQMTLFNLTFMHKINHFGIDFEIISGLGANQGMFYNSTNLFLRYYNPSTPYKYLYNSSGSRVIDGSGNDEAIISIADGKITDINTGTYINESLIEYLTIYKFNFSNSQYFESLYEKINIPSTPTYYSVYNTSGNYETELSISAPSETMLNILTIKTTILTDTPGYLTCFMNNTEDYESMGTVGITPTSFGMYEIFREYRIENMTEFFNESLWTEFDYYCTYNYGGYSETISGTTQINNDTRMFINDENNPIKPDLYELKDSNIGGVLTKNSVVIGASGETEDFNFRKEVTLSVYDWDCLEFDGVGRCIRYNDGGLDCSATDGSTFATKTLSYFPTFSLDNGCYLVKYTYNIDHILGDNSSGLFYRPFCIGINLTTSEPDDDETDFEELTEIDNYEFENETIWSNPLLWVNSFIYQTFVEPNVDSTSANYLLLFMMIFISYWFVLLGIGYNTYTATQSKEITLGVIAVGIFILSTIGWIDSGYKFIILALLVGYIYMRTKNGG